MDETTQKAIEGLEQHANDCYSGGHDALDVAIDELRRLGTKAGQSQPSKIHYAHEAACELTKMADRFDHPGKYTCSWHMKAARVVEALALAISTPGNDAIDELVHVSSSLLQRQGRRGFTLIELLTFIAILSLLITLGGVAMGVTRSMRLQSAANGVTSQLELARDKAALAARLDLRSEYAGRHVAGFSGVRITEDRLIPLSMGSIYAEGRASVHSSFPPGFVPPPGRLVLEEALHDESGLRNNPTSWWWNIRLGDVVRVADHDYIVCGPMEVDNAEGYVNVGNPGVPSPLDRGAGPIEFLYLVNRVDDDRDGVVDSGWNGLDDDLDGVVDDSDEYDADGNLVARGEWEREKWLGLAAAGLTSVSYQVTRRPTVDKQGATQLPSGLAVDFEGSRFWGRTLAGPVDVICDQYGGLKLQARYGVLQTPLGAESIRLRIAELADEDAAVTLAIDAKSGRVETELAE